MPVHRELLSAALLSPADRSILRLAATGMTTDEIAVCLGIGPQQVSRQISRAMSTLGAGSKLEAVVIALSAGVIPPPRVTEGAGRGNQVSPRPARAATPRS